MITTTPPSTNITVPTDVAANITVPTNVIPNSTPTTMTTSTNKTVSSTTWMPAPSTAGPINSTATSTTSPAVPIHDTGDLVTEEGGGRETGGVDTEEVSRNKREAELACLVEEGEERGLEVSLCGNGAVEGGEECDCGAGMAECWDPCCYPASIPQGERDQNSSALPCSRAARPR